MEVYHLFSSRTYIIITNERPCIKLKLHYRRTPWSRFEACHPRRILCDTLITAPLHLMLWRASAIDREIVFKFSILSVVVRSGGICFGVSQLRSHFQCKNAFHSLYWTRRPAKEHFPQHSSCWKLVPGLRIERYIWLPSLFIGRSSAHSRPWRRVKLSGRSMMPININFCFRSARSNHR